MQRLFFKVYSTVIALTVLAFFLTLVFVIYPVMHPIDWENFQQETEVEYRLLISALGTVLNEAQARQVIARYKPVFDLKVSAVKPAGLSPVQQKKLSGTKKINVFSGYEDSDWYAYYRLPNHDVGLLIEETDFSWVEDRESVFLLLIIPFILIMTMSATALILIIRWLSHPLLQLEDATVRFGAGDMSVRVIDANHSPVSSLAVTFNNMAGKIENLVRQQQVMIGAIPHELRTPLHRIRFALDLSRNKQDLAGLRGSIEHIDEYVEELTDTVNEILEFSRLQNGEIETTPSVHVLSLLNKAKDYCRDSEKNIVIECDAGLCINANPKLLSRALLNLALNASRYASSHITLKAFVDRDNSTVILVDDDGEGLAKEYYQQIFLPFFRVDISRNRATGGIGLGLALVQLIIERHGGTIRAKDAPKTGLRMEIRLPFVLNQQTFG